MAKKEKWKVRNYHTDKGRLVVDQDNVLVADCYADSYTARGLPTDYKKLAKRIALLPDMERTLREVLEWVPWGHPTARRAQQMLDKLDKLKT